MDNGVKGLKKLRTGNGHTTTPAQENSKTQVRKNNLKEYSTVQRKFGANGIVK